jgi:(S)-3,5-dihydroxyphenylglycine transaminase
VTTLDFPIGLTGRACLPCCDSWQLGIKDWQYISTRELPHHAKGITSIMNVSNPSALPDKTTRLDVMNFLNEVASRYPSAISFASGRPSEAFFDFENWIERIPEFVRYFAHQRQISVTDGYNLLAQYGRTNGIIGELIARQIKIDEHIDCHPAQILVTAGCQEAIDLMLTSLCQHDDDVVLVRSPCYIGLTGVADLNKIELAPFACDDTDQVPQALRHAVSAVEAQGKRARVLYLVPDFDNPTGSVLSSTIREEIIEYCANKGIVILEDNPYGMFRFQGERVPTMYSMDRHACVVYLGTYSKTICPALRVGFCVIPPHLLGVVNAGSDLLDRLSQAKSFVSVNTSQLTQAVIGALLLSEDCSLARLVAPACQLYRNNRDIMIEHLSEQFSDLSAQVLWNRPDGGFFLTLTLPFPFKQTEAEICANEFGVLVMPLSFFAFDNREDHRVRLAFSNVTSELIGEGVLRLSRFVRSQLGQRRAFGLPISSTDQEALSA